MVEELTGEPIEIPAEIERPGAWKRALMPARVLVLPRSTFAKLEETAAVWPFALGTIAVAALLRGGVALALALRSPQGTRYLASVALRYGSGLLGPIVFALAAAGVLLLAQRLWDGDASFGRLLSAASLALSPLAVRDLVQAAYMGLTRTVLLHPGLSILAVPPHTMATRIAYASLSQVDAFTLWALVLFTLAATSTHVRGRWRATLVALGFAIVAALVGALPSLAFAMLLFR